MQENRFFLVCYFLKIKIRTFVTKLFAILLEKLGAFPTIFPGMLKLENLSKDYKVAGGVVHALKNLNISFREKEFVSILGPSGCGKTTLLNIIGGLDHATKGKLYIDGICTDQFKDRDWDTYRNQRIGFVFQSYNLIPQQTIQENVELALTIGGIKKEERQRRAREMLDKVGLQGQYKKKPNQLSGGQCQRVAIARALINNPEILLADEPTGALDTKTSLQVLDLLKEVAKDRLVIMVTHNPDLAKKYSTRIVRLLDGEIIEDSNPYSYKEEEHETKKPLPERKSRLSFFSAFKLSAQNLRAKIKRTAMVCFAGSIGIIGVGAVLSVSSGVQNYINGLQNDMISGNPIAIDEETMNLQALFDGSISFSQGSEIIKDNTEDGVIQVDNVVQQLINMFGDVKNLGIQNDITDDYLAFVQDMPEDWYNAIAYYYGENISNNLYTDVIVDVGNSSGDGYTEQEKTISLSSIVNMYTKMLELTDGADAAPYVPIAAYSFKQLPNNNDFIAGQYDFVSDPETSYLPTKENEILLVLSNDGMVNDLFLGQYGYYSQDQFFNRVYEALEDPHYDPSIDKDTFTPDELLNKTFYYYPNDAIYSMNIPAQGEQSLTFAYKNEVDSSFTREPLELKITGIVQPKEGVNYGCLKAGFYFTPAFSQKFRNDNYNSLVANVLRLLGIDTYTSVIQPDTTPNFGLFYNQDFYFNGKTYTDQLSSVGTPMIMASIQQSGVKITTLTLRELGGMNTPSGIEVYAKDFTYKDRITSYLDKWNGDETITVNGKELTGDQRSDIVYTDNMAIVMSLIGNMIDIVTFALVAFTALSLVVSTVMIAIITYVSVIERVKEIGVIRSLGGRKIDVSNLFNAETFIIGGISGVIGIAITYIIELIINVIVGSFTGIFTIAALPWYLALVLILVSILLTLVSGVIPARLAAKKDPVEALRSE